jgi:uncharacterized protein YgiM (DUF1202 family)
LRRVVVVAVLLFSLSLPAAADAATRRVCAKSAIVRDTPGGFAIARLYRRQKVTVVRASAARGWTPIRTTNGLPGWILSRSLCRG